MVEKYFIVSKGGVVRLFTWQRYVQFLVHYIIRNNMGQRTQVTCQTNCFIRCEKKHMINYVDNGFQKQREKFVFRNQLFCNSVYYFVQLMRKLELMGFYHLGLKLNPDYHRVTCAQLYYMTQQLCPQLVPLKNIASHSTYYTHNQVIQDISMVFGNMLMTLVLVLLGIKIQKYFQKVQQNFLRQRLINHLIQQIKNSCMQQGPYTSLFEIQGFKVVFQTKYFGLIISFDMQALITNQNIFYVVQKIDCYGGLIYLQHIIIEYT
eukprot:TRINITY_DN1858_c0_g1_i3.p2 TRINITY_DN1858_c0_g1~~TRINITY_DN1858_c0_g1_i3.p2  ORF type:complete len:263 (-),score=-17.17 TRINITY_DN1858_c0_g1_i3:825-1613(-)